MLLKLLILLVVLAIAAYLLPWRYILGKKGVKNGDIYDPMNVFCGSTSCYDVLGVAPTATVAEIKKVS